MTKTDIKGALTDVTPLDDGGFSFRIAGVATTFGIEKAALHGCKLAAGAEATMQPGGKHIAFFLPTTNFSLLVTGNVLEQDGPRGPFRPINQPATETGWGLKG